MGKRRNPQKRILIIAGPNGAGKTTFATEFLPREGQCINFVNADLIAAAYSPFAPELAAVKAARVMLGQLHEHVERGDSFAFETTLSGKTYAALIRRWRERGYYVKLFFLQLPSPELAIERVRRRVLEGGHAVPDDTVRRRFAGGLQNFHTVYKPLVNEWVLYDNSGARAKRIAKGKNR